jgi:hypothetical protein
MFVNGIARRRRHSVLADMVSTAVRTGDFTTPWRATPQVWEHYRNEAEILRELQQNWSTALAGAVYVAIEAGDGDLQQDVMRAFTKMSRRHLGTRRILEANAEHPAIVGAMRKEQALLSSFTGALAAVPTAA